MPSMSPRSTSFERLETGMGPSSSRIGRRFPWRKTAVGMFVLVGLVWLLGPRKIIPEVSTPDLGDMFPPAQTVPLGTNLPTIDEAPEDVGKSPPEAPKKPAATPSTDPTSPETDPDPLKTVHCTISHSSALSIVQYALMIDAGSTGSRIHIYKFNNCGSSPSYEYEVFKMTQPGLSSYKEFPDAAAASLDVLMDEAIRVVPKSIRDCTPVAVKATAGLRLLGATESAAILDAVRERLTTRYPFPLAETDGVVIMDGKDEGVYAWITANYLLNTIRADTPAGTPSYAVLDLGGASTQIVFAPSFVASQAGLALAEGEHKYELKFGGKTHVLYQHSYLGYGLMRARASVHRLIEFMASMRTTYSDDTIIGNPCLAQGTTKTVEIEDEKIGEKRNVVMTGRDIGRFEACNRVVELVMAKDAICELKPCSFDGVYQPSLMDTFPSGKILLLSYFYDRISILMPEQDRPPITINTIANLAQDVCLGRPSWEKRWGGNTELIEELEGRPEWCLDLTFMHALLRLGYELRGEREIELGKQIDGTELGWCLGAAIAMVGGDLKCRA